jgi:cell division protease FtsH
MWQKSRTNRAADVKKEGIRKPWNNLLLLALGLWVALLLVNNYGHLNGPTENVPYSDFLKSLANKNVESVRVYTDRVQGTYKALAVSGAKNFESLRVDDPKLTEELSDSGVRFEQIPQNYFFRDVLVWLLPVLVLGGIWFMVLRGFRNAEGQFLSLGRAKARIYVERDLKIRFNDVAGVDEAKQELQEVVEFLKNPSKYSRLGGKMPKGLLLIGPPGTGKTLLARAVAGEAGVPFFSINGSEFVEMFVGLGAARVRDLFQQARTQAPCIIFIDELDALGKARAAGATMGSANQEAEQTVNQLLAELDGFDPSSGVMLLAATNRPEVLDPALLRSGRFDRRVLIDRPDRRGREQVLRIHLRGVKVGAEVDTDRIAGLTPGFSGADLANLVNEAALTATRRGAQSVEAPDFTSAMERLVAGLERRSRVLSPDERKRVAYHEMGHASLSFGLKGDEIVHKVSIIPRGIGSLGYTISTPTEDRYLTKKSELETRMAILLGGRAAEFVFFEEVSTGGADDLDRVTDIARSMVTRYGMSDTLGLLTFDHDRPTFLEGMRYPVGGHDHSDQTAKAIDAETQRLVERAFHRAVTCVQRHREFIEAGVRELLKSETLDEHKLKDLWQEHQKKLASAPNATILPAHS